MYEAKYAERPWKMELGFWPDYIGFKTAIKIVETVSLD